MSRRRAAKVSLDWSYLREPSRGRPHEGSFYTFLRGGGASAGTGGEGEKGTQEVKGDLGGLIPSEGAYPPLLWLAFFSLLVAMLAAMILELITSSDFVTLTRGAEEIERFAESTNNRLKWRTRVSGWSFALGIYVFLVFVVLPSLVSLIGWWVYPLLIIPPALVYVVLRKWL